MRAVLDTNVLISGLLWHGVPHDCLLAAEAGLFNFVSAEPILDELKAKLIGKFSNSQEEADEVINGLRRIATLVDLTGKSGWVEKDPDDDKFIEAAIESNADAIVSGDRHLLELASVEEIPILKPRQFLDNLNDEEFSTKQE